MALKRQVGHCYFQSTHSLQVGTVISLPQWDSYWGEILFTIDCQTAMLRKNPICELKNCTYLPKSLTSLPNHWKKVSVYKNNSKVRILDPRWLESIYQVSSVNILWCIYQRQTKNKEEIDNWHGKCKICQMVLLNVEGKRVKHNAVLYTNENVQYIPFPKQNNMLMTLLDVVFANVTSKEALLLEP